MSECILLYLVMGKTMTLINRERHNTEMLAEKPFPSMSIFFKKGFVSFYQMYAFY